MPEYLVRDKMHQCCEVTAASVAVEKETGDLVFYSAELAEIARISSGWVGYALKDVVVNYHVVEVYDG